MTGAGRFTRDQPLLMLASLLAVWIGFRVLAWESPLTQALPGLVLPSENGAPARWSAVQSETQPAPGVSAPDPTPERREPFESRSIPAPLPPIELGTAETAAPLAMEPAVAAGHQMLWMAALAHMPMPVDLARQLRQPHGGGPAVPPAMAQRSGPIGPRARRWSLDSWMFLRGGARGGSALAPAPASYGASQVGAVMRYRLAPSSRYDPTAYGRATAALAGGKERDIAVGLAARPLRNLPLTANAELRATRVAGRTHLRPAAFGVLSPAPLSLPTGVEAEAYAQAGYVGGDFATGFADGQLRLTREVARFDLGAVNSGKVRAGAGAWGGAQKGAARLDLGPSASVGFRLGELPARLSVDYRMRVAGDAAPGSGAALTLSTGF